MKLQPEICPCKCGCGRAEVLVGTEDGHKLCSACYEKWLESFNEED